MPELVPIYERLVELAGGDELAARLLSLYRPPGFVVGCSQGAWTRAGGPVLVRNYDYPVARLEGIVYLTQVGRAPRDRHERLPLGAARRDQRRRARDLADIRRPPRRRRRLRDPARRALRARDVRHGRRGARGARADPGARAAEPDAARPLGRVPDGLCRTRARAASSTRSPPRPTIRARSSGRSTRRRSAPSSASAACSSCSTTRRLTREQLHRVVPRAAAAQHGLRAGLRHDLHGRVLPGRGAGRVPLARRRVGAVVRRASSESSHTQEFAEERRAA